MACDLHCWHSYWWYRSSAGGEWGPQHKSGQCHQTACCVSSTATQSAANGILSACLCDTGGCAKCLKTAHRHTACSLDGVYLAGIFLKTKQACGFKENNWQYLSPVIKSEDSMNIISILENSRPLAWANRVSPLLSGFSDKIVVVTVSVRGVRRYFPFQRPAKVLQSHSGQRLSQVQGQVERLLSQTYRVFPIPLW